MSPIYVSHHVTQATGLHSQLFSGAITIEVWGKQTASGKTKVLHDKTTKELMSAYKSDPPPMVQRQASILFGKVQEAERFQKDAGVQELRFKRMQAKLHRIQAMTKDKKYVKDGMIKVG